jgi:hypothetical protein
VNPITHLLASWTVANIPRLEKRDRAIVTISGLIPDLDGAGAIVEVLTRDTGHPLYWWTDYHHVLGHNIGIGLALLAAGLAAGRRRVMTGLMALSAFHLHLLGDLVGARGPEGFDWPIPYLLPFSDHLQLSWSGQWALNAWPNIVITIVLLTITFYLAWLRGFSPLEMISRRADQAFVGALHKRFGSPGRKDPG